MRNQYKDFTIQRLNGKIVNMSHPEFMTDIWLVNDEEKRNIISKALVYILGEAEGFYVWSDYANEEWSDDYYLAVNKNGKIHKYLIDSMEILINFLYDQNFDVYHLVCENNLV